MGTVGNVHDLVDPTSREFRHLSQPTRRCYRFG